MESPSTISENSAVLRDGEEATAATVDAQGRAKPGAATEITGGDTDDATPPYSRIGRYAVTGTLGHGGMGIVLAARDPELERPVAIKLLHPSTRGDPAVAIARLEREAQAMAKLSHPNVVTVYEVGRVDGNPYIAMELVDGQTLRAWARSERPWRQALRTMIAAGRGLAAAHAVGLVHRDFKPENVLIGTDLRPRVSDFGLVSVSTTATQSDDDRLSGGSNMTRGSFLGTPAYMAPEQWSGEPVDHRTDQFAFAVACWELLWGTRPFTGDTRGELRRRVLAGTLTPVTARRGVPKRVEAVLRRALRPARDDRWPDLVVLLDTLERRARDRRPAVAIGLTGLAAVGLVIGLGWRGRDAAASSVCRTAGSELDAIWNPQRRQTLATAFGARPETAAAEVWRDVERSIDGWAAELRTLRVEDCELARSGTEGVAPLAAAREACLDRRAGDLDALLDALETPDVTVVQYARAAARALPRPDGCRAVEPDRSEVAVPGRPSHDELDRAHAALARAAALRALGKPREAVPIATEVAARADELGWSPLIAEAQLELGHADQAIEDNLAGQNAHQQAAWHADASHDDALRFEATLGLSSAAIDHSAFDEAGRLIESARMIARRLPADDGREIALATQTASLASWRGADADCVRLAREAIDLIARTSGIESIDGARMHALLANCLGGVGRDAEVREPLERALAIADATTGREHPLPAEILSNLGSLARDEDRPAEALEYFHESLAIRERIFGPNSPMVAMCLNNIGNALRQLRRFDEARASLEHAIVIWESNWGSDSPAIATSSSALGEVAMDEGDPATAETHFRRALAIRRVKRSATHPDTLKSLVKLARALLAQRDPGCVPLLEEAVAGYAGSDQNDPADLANARTLLEEARSQIR